MALWLSLLSLHEVAAQETVRTAVPRIAPQMQTRIATTPDTLLGRRTVSDAHARQEAGRGITRARYRISGARANTRQPEQAARSYLVQEAAAFGLQAPLDDLVVERVMRGQYSSHVLFQQTYRGVPVLNRRVKVNLDRRGQPTMVVSGYAPEVHTLPTLNVRPTLTEQVAQAVVANDVWQVPVEMSGGERVVVIEADQLRLAWRIIVWPGGEGREWEALVDAHTGAVIRLQDMGTHAAHARHQESLPFVVQPRLTTQTWDVEASGQVVDGSGLVFDPGPLTTAGVAYGDPYIDNNDADTPALNAQLIEVPLLDITQGTDGLYRLQGPFVNITSNIPGAAAYVPPAEADPNGFRYTRADDFFEAVVAYYHIDQSQRYLQTLDIGHDTQNGPISVNPHGHGTIDNSVYNPSSNSIVFGTGGVDDAEDGFVVWHEYGHGLLEGSAPGLRATREGKAFHEGWADYWAASYVRHLVESRQVASTDWVNGFRWDSGDGTIWPGRSFDYVGTYPEATSCDDVPATRCDMWDDGRLWATAMMEVYSQLGKTITDRLNLASHRYLTAPVTFRDGAEAVLQADADLYGRRYLGTLLKVLSQRGLLDADAFGPVVAHQPLPDTEQRGGTILVEAEAVASTVTGVTLVYGFDSAPTQRLPLRLQGTTFRGDLPLTAESTTVSYYLEAEDAAGTTLVFPPTAPAEPYQFDVISNVLVEQASALINVASSGAWTEVDTQWVITADSMEATSSSLVLEPLDMPANIRNSSLAVRHAHNLGDSLGGNVKVSIDGGRSWTLLQPERGYTGTYPMTSKQPLAGEAVFAGASAGAIESRFDLSAYRGKQVRLRIDFASDRQLNPGEFWRIERATISFSTQDNQFEVSREFALHPAFPNPFATHATLSYTLDAPMEVLLDIHDVLGRRITTLVDQQQDAGTYTLHYDARDLAGGVYILRLIAGNSQKTQTLVLQR